jgi:hypothetical protein
MPFRICLVILIHEGPTLFPRGERANKPLGRKLKASPYD